MHVDITSDYELLLSPSLTHIRPLIHLYQSCVFVYTPDSHSNILNKFRIVGK